MEAFNDELTRAADARAQGEEEEAERVTAAAIDELSAAVDRTPDDTVLRTFRGAVYETLERYDDAFADYDVVASLEPSAEAFRNLGDVHAARGEIDAALIDYSRALEHDPAHLAALVARGWIHGQRGDDDLALVDLTRAVEADPDGSLAYLARGQLHGWYQRWAEALEDLSQAIENDGADLRPLELRAYVYERLERYDEALGDHETIVGAAPSAMAYYRRALVLQSLGDLDSARADLDSALTLDPTSVPSLIARAASHGRSRDFESSAQDLSRALEVEPGNTDARTMRAYAFEQLGRTEDALAEYGFVVDRAPSADAFVNRAEAEWASGDVVEAMADANHALELDAASRPARWVRASLHMSSQNLELAVDDFSTLLDNDPEDVEVRRLRGVCREALGDFDAALLDYQGVARAAPSADAFANRGDALLGLERLDDAEADYARALEMDPAFIPALLGRGRAQGLRGDTDAAAEYFAAAVAIDPSNLEARRLRGVALEVLGRYDAALPDYHAVAEGTQRPDAYCAFAEVLLSLGRLDEAIDAYTAALALDEFHSRAWFGRGYARSRAGSFQDALADLSRGLEVQPDVNDAQLLRGIVYEHLDRWGDALAEYDALVMTTGSADAFAHRGGARLVVDDPAGAEADFLQAIELDPGLATAYVGRGRLHASRGEHDRAREAFDAAIAIDGANAEAYVGRANAVAELGESDQATWDYDSALELESDNARALLGRARARAQIAEGFRTRRLAGRFVEACQASLDDLQRTVALVPNDHALYAEIAMALRNLEAFDLAADAAREASAKVPEGDLETFVLLAGERGESLRMWGEELEVRQRLVEAFDVLRDARARGTDTAPTPSWVLDSLGRTLIALERHAEGIACLEEAVRVDDSNLWTSVELGRALYVADDLSRALDVFERALAGDADEAVSLWAHVGRGVVLAGQGADDEARRSLDAGLGSAPTSDDLVDRGLSLSRFGLHDLAETDLRDAAAMDPGSPRPANALAWFHVEIRPREEHFAEALDLARSAVERDTEPATLYDSLDTLGWVLFKLGRFDDAIEPLRRAHELSPHHLHIRTHLAQAQALLG